MQHNIETKRNKMKLEYNGKLYIFAKLNADGNLKFWRCEAKNSKDVKCKARLHTNLNNVVLKQLNQHVCGTDAARIEGQRVVTAIKRRALESLEPPSMIRAANLQNVSTPVLSQVPSKNATKQLIKRARHEYERVPAEPINFEELVIPEAYRIYCRNENQVENFLLADSGIYVENGSSKRILIFGREANGQWANEMRECYLDGTFSISPPLFSQVFAILARRGKWVFPVLYALLPTKSTATYNKMFDLVKQIWPNFAPQSMATDFEMGLINAIRGSFPFTQLNGCFFHLVRNFKKQLAEANLTQIYNNDPNFAEEARNITSLAFVPLNFLTRAIIALDYHIGPELQQVYDWFVINYTGRVRADGTRTNPLFFPEMWNVHGRTVNGGDRTNNFAEAAHRRLQRAFSCDHPSVWRFINTLRREQKSIDADFAHFVAGHEPPPKAKKYRDADNRILSLVQRFNPLNIMEFLRGISRNYQMNE